MAFNNQGAFAPRYSVFEIQNAQKQADPKKIAVNLMLRINKTVDAVNNRVIGIHDLDEGPSGSTYAPVQSGLVTTPRPEYFKTFYAGPLPNAGALTIAHGITWAARTTLIDIEACATDTTGIDSIPLPFVDVSGTHAVGNTEIAVDATNIVITTTGNGTNFNLIVITLRWLQD